METVRRWAVLVGHNDGGAERPRLKYAHADARAMREVLVELGGVDEHDVRLMTDPTVDGLLQEIDGIRAELEQVAGRTEVIFYYSGHSDETGLVLGEGALEYGALRDVFDGLDANARVAIVDSCSSGSLIRSKGGTHQAPFLVDEASRVEGVAYITSSSEDEVAQEAERLQGSFFTHYLTAGLRGAADSSGDDRVSLHEAYTYAHSATLSHTERTRYGPQHAQHDTQLTGTGSLVLTDLRQVDSILVLGEAIGARVSIRTEEGRLVAEVDKRAGEDLALALPDGLYELTLSDEGRFADVSLEVAPGTSAVLDGMGLQWMEGETTAARGGESGAQEALESTPVRLSIVPRPGDEDLVDHVSFSVLMSRAGGLDGFAGGLGVAHVAGDARGLMFSLAANVSDQEVHGAQVSLGYNHARRLRGAQVALGANLAHAEANGVQAALGFNGLVGTGAVLQLGGAGNLLKGDFDGAQVAPFGVNVADGLRGLQLGLVNVGGRVHGVQLGLVNVAHHVKGTQIGLVNIANELRGPPVGLLSISRNGRYDLAVFASASDLVNGDFKIGGRTGPYTVFGAGGRLSEHFYASLGMGVHIPMGRPWLDVDVSLPVYQSHESAWSAPPTLVLRSRVLAGFSATSWLAPFAGLTFDWRLPTDGRRTVTTLPADWVGRDSDRRAIIAWPGFVAGISF